LFSIDGCVVTLIPKNNRIKSNRGFSFWRQWQAGQAQFRHRLMAPVIVKIPQSLSA
jgi:hypothetical protein